MKNKLFKHFSFSLVTLLVILVGFVCYNVKSSAFISPEAMKTATILQKPRALPSFSLVDQDQKPFTEEKLKGKWSLLFFGFTHCPAICPTTLANLSKVFKKLEESKLKQLPNMLFISLDPKKDTPPILKKYLSHFNPNFVGVTGNKKQIDQLVNAVGAVYMENVIEAGQKKDYTIDHSASVFIIDPKGNFYGLFSSSNAVEELTADLKKIIL